jgi:hypothetical protein
MGSRVRSLKGAAAFVDRAGIVLVFAKEGIGLASLSEAVAGPGPFQWMEESEDGKAQFSPEAARVWEWKDGLAADRLACAGKHVRGWPVLVSLALLPALYALTGRAGEPDDFRQEDLPPLEREVAEVVLAAAPTDSREIRRLLGGRDTARVNRAIDSLQRRMVLTRAGTVEREAGWPGTAYDVLAHRYADRLRALPGPDQARAEVAAAVLRRGPLSVGDLRRAVGFTSAEALGALEHLAGEGRARCQGRGPVAVWTMTPASTGGASGASSPPPA